jgi:hypothetical protein
MSPSKEPTDPVLEWEKFEATSADVPENTDDTLAILL